MAKKEVDGEVVYRGTTSIGGSPASLGFIVGIFVLCWAVHRSGYNAGVGVSNKVLRRHDKDVRRMTKQAAKREKQLKKELKPEEEKKYLCPW